MSRQLFVVTFSSMHEMHDIDATCAKTVCYLWHARFTCLMFICDLCINIIVLAFSQSDFHLIALSAVSLAVVCVYSWHALSTSSL